MRLQASIDLNCVVVKEGNKYCVKSEDRSKNLGCKPSKEGAKKRLQQVEYWKHVNAGGPGSGRKKGSGHKKKGKKWSKMSEEERRSAAFHDPRQGNLFSGGPGSGKHKYAVGDRVMRNPKHFPKGKAPTWQGKVVSQEIGKDNKGKKGLGYRVLTDQDEKNLNHPDIWERSNPKGKLYLEDELIPARGKQ